MPKPTDPTFFVPTPTRGTVFLRTFLPWQLARFAWINLKMIRMISIGNHGTAPLWQFKEIEEEHGEPPRGDGRAAGGA